VIAELIPKLVGARDASEALGVHVNTLKRIPPERLPFYRVTERGDRRYRPEDLERYLRERLVDRSLTLAPEKRGMRHAKE
jgi:hypothetical protein